MAVLLGAFALTSCKKEEIAPATVTPTPTTPTSVKIASATTTSGVVVDLYAKSATLSDGHNPMYVKVTDASGTNNSSATVTFNPMMDMGTMMHSCPFENPVYNGTTNMYEGAIVFIMPTTATGSWSLGINVNGETVSFPLTIAASATKMVGGYTGTDGKVYFVSMVKPSEWKVGMNDVEILIHERASMMSFPANNGFDVLMTPEMISMGHGSPNNVSPTLTSNGHYKGKVNFTMTGDWRLHFELKMGSTVIHSDAYLDILF